MATSAINIGDFVYFKDGPSGKFYVTGFVDNSGIDTRTPQDFVRVISLAKDNNRQVTLAVSLLEKENSDKSGTSSFAPVKVL